MDEYHVEVLGAGWRVLQSERGTVGMVMHQGGRFAALVDVEDTSHVIAYGFSVKAAVEQVIWYDRAMNQEAE